ncbi:MAG: sensor histidine kinase [Polyangiales bacterium]
MSEADEAARLALARFRVEGDDKVETALRHATRISAQRLHCARVGVWLFTDQRRDAVVSSNVYDLRRDTWEPDPMLISEEQFPLYFSAIREHRAVVANDALRSGETAELGAPYLLPRGITSMLDVPIYRAGEVVGLVCHEHVGTRRTWSESEIAFATSVADVVAVVLERSERLAIERELHAQERANLELQHAQEMGRIAGAVGHDLNNLLSVIVAASDVLTPTRGVPTRLVPQVEAIHDAARRGAGLARQLLELGRGLSRREPEPCDLAATLVALRPILERLVAGQGSLTLEIEGGPLMIRADAGDVERIVVNLVSNARDAIEPGGGIRVLLRASAEDVTLVVRDNGHGMSAEVRARIFEPFFTTKNRERGTGLGLAIVVAIAERVGGGVQVESEPGHGTAILVRLPRA